MGALRFRTEPSGLGWHADTGPRSFRRFLVPLSARFRVVTAGAFIAAGLVEVAAEPGPRSRTDFGAMGTAKILCSSVFVSERDLDEALRHSGLNNYLTTALGDSACSSSPATLSSWHGWDIAQVRAQAGKH